MNADTRHVRTMAGGPLLEALEGRCLLSGNVWIVADAPTVPEVGGQTTSFTVSRDGATDQSLPVSLRISGSASLGKDYQRVAKTALIPAGDTSTVIEILPIHDPKLTGPQTVVFSISKKSGYAIKPGQGVATITILDTEKPVVSLKSRVSYITEDGKKKATLTISRTGPVPTGYRSGFRSPAQRRTDRIIRPLIR